MQSGSQSLADYEPVTPARGLSSAERGGVPAPQEPAPKARPSGAAREDEAAAPLKRAHSLSFVCLFLFTLVLYLRPAEIYPSFVANNIAFFFGVLTLASYLLSQLSAEGTLTARPREVNAILLLSLAALLSIPMAASPGRAWESFSGVFIRCVLMFLVIVNAVRTERRLRMLILLALAVSCWLSLGAFDDFRAGRLTVEGYRVGGHGSGIFGNPNDLALHLVTMVPLAAGLLFASRGALRRVCYAAAALLMSAGIVVTYSRGGFLGLICALSVLGWKLGRRHRLAVFGIGGLGGLALLVFAPGNYALRLLSIFVPSLDPVGSSTARQGELIHSLWATIYNPIFGVGMGNYVLMSAHEHVTHNAYTEVSAELGLFALGCYLVFLFTPLGRLRRVEREALARPELRRYHYLAVALQASLVGYIVSSFFASVAFLWYVYYLVGYAISLERLFRSESAAHAPSGGDDEGKPPDGGGAEV
jgi:O-antigen ligase